MLWIVIICVYMLARIKYYWLQVAWILSKVSPYRQTLNLHNLFRD